MCLSPESTQAWYISDNQGSMTIKRELALIYLDLANAHITIPHKLAELTLGEILWNRGFQIQRKIQNETFSEWQYNHIARVRGTHFNRLYNLLINSTENRSRGAVSKIGTLQPPTRAFIDDMTVMTRANQQGRWTLRDLDTRARKRFQSVNLTGLGDKNKTADRRWYSRYKSTRS